MCNAGFIFDRRCNVDFCIVECFDLRHQLELRQCRCIVFVSVCISIRSVHRVIIILSSIKLNRTLRLP